MNKKISILTSLSISSVLFITGALALSNNSNLIFNVGGVYGDTSDYTVTLDNSNAYTSGTNKDITKSSGSWTINFAYTNAVLTAFSDLVVYSSCGKGAGNSNGLCMFFCANSTDSTYAKSVYTSKETNFTNWLNLQKVVGYL